MIIARVGIIAQHYGYRTFNWCAFAHAALATIINMYILRISIHCTYVCVYMYVHTYVCMYV